MQLRISALLCLPLMLAACGGGEDPHPTQSAALADSGPGVHAAALTSAMVTATVTMDDLLQPTAGMYGLFAAYTMGTDRQISANLRIAARFANTAIVWAYDPATGTRSPVGTSGVYVRDVLNESGNWESKTWTWETTGYVKGIDGSYTLETWFGGQAKTDLADVIDVSGQPIAQYLPVTAMLRSGTSIKSGAVFAPGSKYLRLSAGLKSDTYTLMNDLGATTVTDWVNSLDAGTLLGYTGVQVNIARASASSVSGTYTWSVGTKSGTGTWKRIVVGPTSMLVFLGGSKETPIFSQNLYGGHPLYSIKDGHLFEGYYGQAGVNPYPEEDDWAWREYNKAAIKSIEANAEQGTLFGYGTPTSALALKDGVNYVYEDGKGLHLDRNVLQNGQLKNNNRYTLDPLTHSFVFDGSLTPQGMETNTWLNSSGIWNTITAYPSVALDDYGSMVQTANSWNGGKIVTRFNSVDIAGQRMGKILDVDKTGLYNSSWFIKKDYRFSPGAKFISHQYIQQTAGYQLWTWSTPYSTLAATVDDTTIDMWTGKAVKFVFPDVSGSPTSGTLQVVDSGDSTVYGTAKWAIKTVNGAKLVVVTDIPAAAETGNFLGNLNNPIFAVNGGTVYRGSELLPGLIINTSNSVVLNKIAVTDLENATVN